MKMDRLRPRERRVFSGFTTAEIEKMEKLHKESGEQSLDLEFCKRIARSFNCSKGRAGKPAVKWTEVQNWFQNRQQSNPLKVAPSHNLPEKSPIVPEACLNKVYDSLSKGERVPDQSELEFEAKSSKDGAWYDVDTFLAHRFLSSGEAEFRLRFVGFGATEDEWVNVKNASIRVRSLPLEPSECGTLKVGDLVLCFQEKRNQLRYYDAHIVAIQRRVHDIRGCRCLFLIRYDHDNTEARKGLSEKIMLPASTLDFSSDAQFFLQPSASLFADERCGGVAIYCGEGHRDMHIAEPLASQPKWECKVSTRLTHAAADQIWPLYKDFFNLHKWFPGLPTCYGVHGTNGEVGCIRYAGGFALPSHGSSGEVSWSTERLIAIDPVARIISYEIVDCNTGFQSYVSTVKIVPQDEGCLIEWSFSVDPVEGWRLEDLVKRYEDALVGMAKKMEDAIRNLEKGE